MLALGRSGSHNCVRPFAAVALVTVTSIASALALHAAAIVGWHLPAWLFELGRFLPNSDCYIQPLSRVFDPRELPTSFDGLVNSVVGIACIAFVMHGAVFLVAAKCVQRLGWPRYWHDLGLRHRNGLLMRAWWQSSACLVLALPAMEIAWVFFYRTYQTGGGDPRLALDLGGVALALNRLMVPVVDFLVISIWLARQVRRSIAAPDRRCLRCGQRLVSSMAAPCPECGLLEKWPFRAEFRLCPQSRLVPGTWLLAILMLLAPLVIPQARALWNWLAV